jgi:signal transduction histidine kinase/GAF domain-containing protein
MVLLVSGLVYLVIRSGLSSVTHSIRQLTDEADRIGKGQLDHMQYIRGEDEIGKLGFAFEQMRMKLKDQVDELTLLLGVSQGIAGNLQIEEAVQPILNAAMSNGGSSARIVLVPDPSLDPINTSIERYGSGEMVGHYQYLDDQILSLTRNRDSITLNNLMRGRALKLNPEVLNPSAIISVPLRHDGHFLGVLWVSYDQPRTFSDEEVQFLDNLSEDVSRALANIRLFRTAELGRQRLEAILNSTPDPTFVIDSSQRIILANPPAVELFETREFFIEGKTVDEAIHSSVMLDLIRTGETNREIRFPNHKVFYAYQSNMILDGQLAGRMCILRDITHFKEVDSLKTEFVATVSHDLRAPLTLMRGNATMLQMVGELNEQQKNYVKKIISGIESMTSLVNNLLDLGRIEAGMALQLAPVRAIVIVNKVIANLNLQANQKNIQITAIQEEGLEPEVHVDQALIEQALYNLVENGIKFTPVGGKVMVSIKDHGSKVVFEVKDTGIGIAPLDIPKLFEKFFRMSQRDGFFQKGSSLGLSIVKSIAERHGGRVWVDSQLGKGSTFYLEVPAFQRIEEEPAPEGDEEN